MGQFGFDLRNYQRLEAGSHSPSLYTLHKLAVSFKVPVENFFE
jgi:transcriptional regulator with XRE-family HTH domain